jgi:hypothetical protein
MVPSRCRTHHPGMDIVALLMGVVMFALLLVLLEGVQRI